MMAGWRLCLIRFALPAVTVIAYAAHFLSILLFVRFCQNWFVFVFRVDSRK